MARKVRVTCLPAIVHRRNHGGLLSLNDSIQNPFTTDALLCNPCPDRVNRAGVSRRIFLFNGTSARKTRKGRRETADNRR